MAKTEKIEEEVVEEDAEAIASMKSSIKMLIERTKNGQIRWVNEDNEEIVCNQGGAIFSLMNGGKKLLVRTYLGNSSTDVSVDKEVKQLAKMLNYLWKPEPTDEKVWDMAAQSLQNSIL